MNANKQVEQSLERLHIKKVRRFYRSIADINVELSKVHNRIGIHIDKEKYILATQYVDQYISYTSIWNLKFVYNLESPEVALLQIFHLDYIFEHEDKNQFIQERKIFEEQKNKFYKLQAFKTEHIVSRKQKMLEFISKQKKA